MEARDILSIMFAAIAVIGVLGGITERIVSRRGIGSQFIRFMALVVTLPLAATFVLQGMLTEAVASLILGILGYIFASSAKGT